MCIRDSENLIKRAFKACKLDEPDSVTAEIVDQFFVKHPKHKGKFALVLALLIDKNLNSVVVPSHISEMFTWLYGGTEPNSTPVDDLI